MGTLLGSISSGALSATHVCEQAGERERASVEKVKTIKWNVNIAGAHINRSFKLKNSNVFFVPFSILTRRYSS